MFSSATTVSLCIEDVMSSIFFRALSTLSSEYPRRTCTVILSFESATPSVPMRCLLTSSLIASLLAELRKPFAPLMLIWLYPRM